MLSWRNAASQDQSLLHDFKCTDPPRAEYQHNLRRKVHPREYELKVQSLFRGVRVPVSEPNAQLLLGLDSPAASVGERLCAAVYWAFGEVRLGDESLPGYEIRAIAVSYECRNQRLGVEALEQVLEAAHGTSTLNGLDDSDVVVMAQIHIDNEPSQKLFRRFGFTEVDKMSEHACLWMAPTVSAALAAGSSRG